MSEPSTLNIVTNEQLNDEEGVLPVGQKSGVFRRQAKQIEELRLENEALAKELNELKERIEREVYYYAGDDFEEASHSVEDALYGLDPGDVVILHKYSAIQIGEALWGAVSQDGEEKVFETEAEARAFAASGGEGE